MKRTLLFVCAIVMMSSCSSYKNSTSTYVDNTVVCVGDRFLYQGCPNRQGMTRSYTIVVRKITRNGKWILCEDEMRKGKTSWFCIPYFKTSTYRLTTKND